MPSSEQNMAIVKDLKHLFGVFLEKVLDVTNQEPLSTPVSQDQSLPGPDMVRWDKEACKYKIAEPVETSGPDDYAKYAFVVRERIERNSEDVTPYIDIKSESLRDILRAVLHDVKAISLMEDKPSALFKPGCHVYTTCIGTKEPRCVVFDAGEEITQNDETWFNLECRFLDYDGVKFGEAGIFLRVLKFRGSKPIATLEAYPLCYYPSHEQHCKGSAFFMNKGKIFKININSRVVVDAVFFHEMQPNYSRPLLRDLGVKDKGGIAVFDIGAIVMEDREREKERIQGDGVDAQKLSETNFLVACLTVCCFSFKEKIFLECAVGALRDVDWLPESFDCLKIPSENKTILLSLAKTRFNILLNGLPGVGKTFTVEATSEYFKLPLYSISAGELVVDHGDSNALEQQLKTVFKIAKHFNAVLLLDELEYYQGILFLTSNRGVQFDDAILSRIYLVIEYENLTREFRRDLWSTFLSKACTMKGPAFVEEHELRRLESLALNGREIKNIAAIAHALAEADVKQVNFKYLELAAESNKKFSKEFGQERPADGMYV
ncbi:hypothetical protein PDE_01127 [Penicillium oxalicum 114-2]|uniref:AAA+ ATPase domain-containing protein n=1 Tax=Penicillium oxalicum (strain 114-2 / CGMCC 5302) TaxID=933388 RepID=S7ZBW9_PENO1|nr:hypothetical protein PDE_01127 [Penicillium oxalicum 114-2]